MPTPAEQLAAIDEIHKEYVAELSGLSVEEQKTVHDFLERIRQKKIKEITEAAKTAE